jgi:hypothetical protein
LLKDKKWGPASKVPSSFSLAAFAAVKIQRKISQKEKHPPPVVLMSGSLKAFTLRQLSYASASRSTHIEQGQQHEIAEAKFTLANYPGAQS